MTGGRSSRMGKELVVFNRYRRELGLIIAWLIFPLVPVVLEDAYYGISNLNFNAAATAGPDPHVWQWGTWVIMLGPLLGFGFLAGATLNVPEHAVTPRRGLRRLFARRSLWVAIGPWWGALVCVGLYFGLASLDKFFLRSESPPPPVASAAPEAPPSWFSTWATWAMGWAIAIGFVTIWAYSWLWPAWAALRRAARIGEWKRSFVRGVITAGTFAGSLFGSFWAATAIWRSYFFDSRVVPIVLLAVGLAVVSGCGGPITYGETRRRELFHAMLVAWVLGLALLWRWWSRERPGRPADSASDSSTSH